MAVVYDGEMDRECIDLCDELNKLPGVETVSSCCGHLKNRYMIFFRCTNQYSLAIIARAFNYRYSGTLVRYDVFLDTCDAEVNPQYEYCIMSDTPYLSQEDLEKDVDSLIMNLRYWQNSTFDEYFKKNLYVTHDTGTSEEA